MDTQNPKTIVLTGGSSGIGLATAQLFASKGWKVFSLSRSETPTEGVTHVPCDVTSEESVSGAIQRVLSMTNRIDVALSNAGYGISGPVEFTELADAKQQFDVNFFGAVTFVKAVLPQMRKQQSGTIIFTSSVAAVLSVPYQGFYSASKAAINALALALANEVRPFGIRVSCLMPGDVATGFTAARNKSQCGESVYTRSNSAISTMEKDEQSGMTPHKMARKLWWMANKKSPAPFYIGGTLYQLFGFLDWLLPKRLVNWIEGQMYA
ncbi:MAG: SDR family NAD(P)-dependent oxidoreductase [Paludibacteraceae bacterium]|nr:SDR family NAD(P)-dependent oxidoreductase [Paludibacteraceae bacterium]